MTRVCTILIFLAFLSLNKTEAQSQKTGYIDSDAIVEQMPEYAGIGQRLNLLRESWQEELRVLEEQIDELEEEFDAREVLYTDEMREQIKAEIAAQKEEKDRYLQEKFGPEGEYFQRQREFLEPVQRQVFDAVHRVAEREGYDFVFDLSGDPRVLFADPQWNLTEAVMTDLGLEPSPE